MSHSQAIANRFQLASLSACWIEWFDAVADTMDLPGAFNQPYSPELLGTEGQFVSLAGLIPPDCLPVLSNGYGDWICARVTDDDTLGELIHWYHGGGDWIPVGRTPAEACLHDFVDRFRPTTAQMLRSAPESVDGETPLASSTADWLSEHPQFRDWLTDNIPDATTYFSKTSNEPADHEAACRWMLEQQLAVPAVACDLIESLISSPVSRLASPKYASLASIAWTPDYLRLMFDFESASPELVRAFSSAFKDEAQQFPSDQDWESAGGLAAQIWHIRRDLGWTRDVLGWSMQRRGDIHDAIEIYRTGARAAVFSDQAVRLRSHWFGKQHPNFAYAQLESLGSPLHRETAESRLDQAHHCLATGSAQAAYEAAYEVGWEIGFKNLKQGIEALKIVCEAAQQLDWKARHATAQAHLDVLTSRF
ncbi:MAG TPA: hypothetical protein DDW52_27395 [Planctomycetaceae bacterium]|nr:hypothetical protein [Planctomycetaceae bacterium]